MFLLAKISIWESDLTCVLVSEHGSKVIPPPPLPLQFSSAQFPPGKAPLGQFTPRQFPHQTILPRTIPVFLMMEVIGGVIVIGGDWFGENCVVWELSMGRLFQGRGELSRGELFGMSLS